ncbi:MAG: hypothetical protein COA78_04255 [Blastopirellula sp.]|nr:MAG: hypothetical protein COA78_04255 [Blastopirellula sp.]
MSTESATIPAEQVATASPYGTTFWLSYLANTALIVCLSLQFRYADFILYLGGNELLLGYVTGCGMFGALFARLGQGPLIDRIGSKTVWLVSLIVLNVSLMLHLLIHDLGPAVYLVRLLMMIGFAGAFGASLTFISVRAPAGRTAEMIGMLGSSGFIGLAIGPILGDWIYGPKGSDILWSQVSQMFGIAIAAVSVSLFFAFLATRNDPPVIKTDHPSPLQLIKKYHPGWILLMSFVMGIGLFLPQIFLSSFTKEMGLNGIKVFFVVYAIVAFSVRLCTATFPQRYGVKRMTVIGVMLLAMSAICYPLVHTDAMLALPAVFGGLAHAFLFPAIIGGGSSAFPRKYRGTGTTLMLAALDTGGLVGQPVIGTMIVSARDAGLPAYDTMFFVVASFMCLMALLFAFFGNDNKCERLESE